MPESNEDQKAEIEYPHWNRVYVTVIIYTFILIIALWAFSRMFQ